MPLTNFTSPKALALLGAAPIRHPCIAPLSLESPSRPSSLRGLPRRVRPATSNFAAAEVAKVVDAGLMAPSVESFRPADPLTASEIATVIASLGGTISVTDPDAPVTVRQLDARLVTLAGLRPAAQTIRLAAVAAELGPRPWLGTETVARMLGLRVNHPREEDQLELQLSQPITRAEAAYSIAVYLGLTEFDREAVRSSAEAFSFPSLTEWQRVVVARGCGSSGPRTCGPEPRSGRSSSSGQVLPGGFDCSGFCGASTSSGPSPQHRTSPACWSAARATR